MAEFSFTVHGTPEPQGSKRHVGNGVMVESSKRVRPWRADVREAAERALSEQPGIALSARPLAVEIIFSFARPKGHYRTGRNASFLRDGAPCHPAGKPDVDKLSRAVLDALTAVTWLDDAQVTDLHALKRYCHRGQPPGAVITIREIWEQEP